MRGKEHPHILNILLTFKSPLLHALDTCCCPRPVRSSSVCTFPSLPNQHAAPSARLYYHSHLLYYGTKVSPRVSVGVAGCTNHCLVRLITLDCSVESPWHQSEHPTLRGPLVRVTSKRFNEKSGLEAKGLVGSEPQAGRERKGCKEERLAKDSQPPRSIGRIPICLELDKPA